VVLFLALILMAWCKYSVLITILWTDDHLQNRVVWVSKQFSFTMATSYLIFLLVIQCIIKSHKKTWRFCWKPLTTINSIGKSAATVLILGLKQGFTKYCCFICEWDSKTRSLHYSIKDWPARKSLEPRLMNVENQPLEEPSKILFHPWI